MYRTNDSKPKFKIYFLTVPNSRILFTHDGNKSCAFNMEFLGSGGMAYGPVYYDYCNIGLDGISSGSPISNSYIRFNKCNISGKLPWRGDSYFSGDDNVFDIEVPQGATIGTSYLTNAINDDKVYNRYNTNSSNDKFIKVTEAQFSDAAYLQSIGFSIAAG